MLWGPLWWSLSPSTANGLPWSRMALLVLFTAECSRDTSLRLRSWCSVSWLTISKWNCFLDSSGIARKNRCLALTLLEIPTNPDFHLPIWMFTDMVCSNRGERNSILVDWETSANKFIPRIRIRCPKIMHIWDVSWPEPLVLSAIHWEKQLTQLLPCCNILIVKWYSGRPIACNWCVSLDIDLIWAWT